MRDTHYVILGSSCVATPKKTIINCFLKWQKLCSVAHIVNSFITKVEKLRIIIKSIHESSGRNLLRNQKNAELPQNF